MELVGIVNELQARRLEMKSRLERTHKHIHEKEEPVSANFSEQIKQTENDQLVMALDAEAAAEIRQIDAALKRIDQGVYEQCASCGSQIADARLKAIPYTDCCIDCANQQ